MIVLLNYEGHFTYFCRVGDTEPLFSTRPHDIIVLLSKTETIYTMVVMNIPLCSSDYAGNILDSFSYLLFPNYSRKNILRPSTEKGLNWRGRNARAETLPTHYVL